MSLPTFTHAQVAIHNKSGDAWVVIRGNVYNVSKFLDEHPGGEEVLLDVAGKNATREYDDVGHSDEADTLMAKYLIGTYDATSAPTPAAGGAKNDSDKKKNASSSSVNSAGGAGIAGYVVPIVVLLACFVAAKYFNIL